MIAINAGFVHQNGLEYESTKKGHERVRVRNKIPSSTLKIPVPPTHNNK
jgi:hypothetical protein